MPVPIEVFLSNRDLWLPVVCLLAILVGLSIPLSAKAAVLFRSNRLVTLCALSCLAATSAFTLPTRLSPQGARFCAVEGLPDIASVTDPQNFLNMALYVPPAFLGVLVTRRFPAVVIGLAATSICIELAQIFADQRHCSSTDMIFNILGALAGAGAATAAPAKATVAPRRSGPEGNSSGAGTRSPGRDHPG